MASFWLFAAGIGVGSLVTLAFAWREFGELRQLLERAEQVATAATEQLKAAQDRLTTEREMCQFACWLMDEVQNRKFDAYRETME